MKLKKITEYKLKLKRNITPRNLLIIDDHLYIAFIFDQEGWINSRIVCLDVESFEEKWSYDYPFIVNTIQKSPLSDNIISVCMDGIIEEIDRVEGVLLESSSLNVHRCGFSSSIVDNKVVVGGIQGSKLTTCFDLKEADIHWTFDTGGHSYKPLIAEGKVYQCTENYLRCLDFDSGKLIWQAYEESTYLFNIEIFQGVVLASGHGLINFYSIVDGTLIYQINTGVPGSEGAIRHIICINEFIYFSDSSGIMYCYKLLNLSKSFEIDIEVVWTCPSNGAIASKAEVYKDYLIFAHANKELLVLDRMTGNLVASSKLKASAEISNLLVQENGAMYLAYEKGYVNKFCQLT